MVKVDTVKEYANLIVFKNYCNNMIGDNCQICVLKNLCDCCSEPPGNMEIEYIPEGDDTYECSGNV